MGRKQRGHMLGISAAVGTRMIMSSLDWIGDGRPPAERSLPVLWDDPTPLILSLPRLHTLSPPALLQILIPTLPDCRLTR